MGSSVPEREVEPGRSQDGFRVATFFALTFVLSWTCWIPIIGSPAHAPSTAQGLVWLVGVFAPAIASLLLTAFFEGRRAMRTLLGRIVRWRAAPRYYLVAIGFMLAVKVATALVVRLSTGVWPGFGSERPIIILAAIALSTPLQVGEELGWRGYALPRMASHLGLRSASLLLGLFWACWHLPQFFLQGADTYRQSFPFFALEVIALSVAMAWLYEKTNGSLLVVMLMHAANNNVKDIVPSAMPGAHDVWSLHASPVLYGTVAVLWIAAMVFLARMPD